MLAGLLALGSVAAAAALYWFWPFGRSGGELRLPGVVEIQEVRLGPRVAGRVTKVSVAEGDDVKAGDVVVELQAPELDAQLVQWKGDLQQAQAELERLKQPTSAATPTEPTGSTPRDLEISAAAAAEDAAHNRLIRMRVGSRPQEITEARSDLAAAQADAANAKIHFDRSTALYEKQAIRKEELDDCQTALDRARSVLAAAQAKLALVESGNRIEDMEEAAAQWRQAKANHQMLVEQTPLDVKAAEAKVEQARGKVEEIEADLRELVVKAPEPAYVEVVSVRPGDLVAPNQPIVRVLRTADLWIKVYVAETDQGKVRKGQEVMATVDSYPGRALKGRIVQINAEAEFTPRNVQSVDERRHQVFGVKVRVDDPQGIFKSGMAAEVVVPLAP